MGKYDPAKLAEEGKLIIHGRTKTESFSVPLFWTGSGIEINIKASYLSVSFDSDYDQYENWISVFINGEMSQRIMLPKGRSQIVCFRMMNSEEAKNVRIYRENQPFESDKSNLLIVNEIETDGEFLDIQERKLKLEFIGDSITSAEGCIGSKKDMDWLPMFFSAANSYSKFLAGKLDADYRVISQSGWGMLCGWDANPYCSITDFYESVCGLLTGEKQLKAGSGDRNDFSAWQPDFIIMNLGTNDFSGFNQAGFTVSENAEEYFFAHPETKACVDSGKNCYVTENGKLVFRLRMENGEFNADDAAFWVKKAVSVLKMLRKNNPKAHIIWAAGMLGTGILPLVNKAVETYTAESSDLKVSVAKLTECNDETVGSRCHPGKKNHMEAADTLYGIISALIK